MAEKEDDPNGPSPDGEEVDLTVVEAQDAADAEAVLAGLLRTATTAEATARMPLLSATSRRWLWPRAASTNGVPSQAPAVNTSSTVSLSTTREASSSFAGIVK